MPRLVVIGGSSLSTPGLALALRRLRIVDEVELVLHGRTKEKLESVADACQIALRDTQATVRPHTDLHTPLLCTHSGGGPGRRQGVSDSRIL